jgi:hypothetical protein
MNLLHKNSYRIGIKRTGYLNSKKNGKITISGTTFAHTRGQGTKYTINSTAQGTSAKIG